MDGCDDADEEMKDGNLENNTGVDGVEPEVVAMISKRKHLSMQNIQFVAKYKMIRCKTFGGFKLIPSGDSEMSENMWN